MNAAIAELKGLTQALKPDELNRAKATLRTNVLINLERQADRLEDTVKYVKINFSTSILLIFIGFFFNFSIELSARPTSSIILPPSIRLRVNRSIRLLLKLFHPILHLLPMEVTPTDSQAMIKSEIHSNFEKDFFTLIEKLFLVYDWKLIIK